MRTVASRAVQFSPIAAYGGPQQSLPLAGEGEEGVGKRTRELLSTDPSLVLPCEGRRTEQPYVARRTVHRGHGGVPIRLPSAALLVCAALLISINSAAAAPDTAILTGPESTTDRSDVVFWWVGISDEPASPTLGYRYALDEGPAVFSTAPTVALYNLSPGEHRFRVAAVNSRLEEDPTPAERAFRVTGNFINEVEQNDTPAAATNLASGQEARGVSSAVTDVDYFHVPTLPDSRQITITFRRPSGARGKTTVQLFRNDPALNDLLATATVGPENAHRTAFTVGTRFASHFVRTQANADEAPASPYILSVTAEPLDALSARDTEPNDTPADANERTLTLALPQHRILGATNGAADADWFRIRVDVPAPQLLRTTLFRPGVGGETRTSVYAGSPPLAEGQIAQLRASVATGQFATFETPVTLGDYFVRVDSSAATGDAPYVLFLALSAIPADGTLELEPNGADPRQNPRSPNVLPLGGALAGTSWDGSADTDWLRLDVPRPGVLTLTFRRPSGRGATRMRVFSPNFSLLGEATANTTSAQSVLLARAVGPGVHFVELQPSDESPDSSYRIAAALESPGVFSASHSATRPLRRDEVLAVALLAPPGNRAAFSIGTAKTAIPMFDDGAHGDGAAGDGTYAGAYTVAATDELRDEPVLVTVRNDAGEETTRTLERRVTLDAIAPPAVSGVVAQDRPDDDGGVLLVRWTAVPAADVAEYRLYVSESPLRATAGLVPSFVVLQTSAELSVGRHNRDVFVLVTAADRAGNESPAGVASTAGPVRALDNRRPNPADGVLVEDTPDDFGGQITLAWNPSQEADFAEYRIYLDGARVVENTGRTPRARVAHRLRTVLDIGGLPDGSPVFAAVAVVDVSGNESLLGPESSAGPAVPAPNRSPDPSPLALVGPTGIVRGTAATFLWRRFPPDGSARFDRYRVQIDDLPAQFTADTSATFHGLAAGAHTVRVSVPERNVTASHTFRATPFVVPDVEPNDSEAQAETIAVNLTVRGVVGPDADWFRLPLSRSGLLALAVRWIEGEAEVRVYREIATPETLALVRPRNAAATPFLAASAGALLVEFRGSGTYEFLPLFYPQDAAHVAEFEPNDGPNTATSLSLDRTPITVRGLSHADGDVDWFAFVPAASPGPFGVSSATRVEARAYRPPTAGATRFRLYRARAGAADAQVGEWVLGGGVVSAAFTTSVAPDAYFLAVESEKAAASEYHLALSLVEETAAREMEPNSLAANATPLPLDRAVEGDSWRAHDVDAFRVETDRRGLLLATLERPGARVSTRLRLRDAAGAEVAAAASDPTTGGLASLQADVPRGTYFLFLEPDGDPAVPYRLHTFFVERLEHDATSPRKAGDALTVQVLWSAGRTVTLDLLDSGGNVLRAGVPLSDDLAGGTYVATVVLRPEDEADPLSLRAHFQLGDLRTVALFPKPVRMDTVPPTVRSAAHDARRPLRLGDALVVKAVSETGLTASFALLHPDGTALRANLPMLDDGTAGDPQPGDGEYTGRYDIRSGDNAEGALVVVTLSKRNGKTATQTLAAPVILDTLPPFAVRNVRAEDVPDDEGGFVQLRWDTVSASDLARYELFRSPAPVVSLQGMAPVEVVPERDATARFLRVPNDVPFYFAVAAMDRAGNVSPLAAGATGSTTGPVRARDNLPPPPVHAVRASDRPNDAGGALTVTWEPSIAPDFAEYRLYLSATPFEVGARPDALAPVARIPVAGVVASDIRTPTDDTDYFVAVAAADTSGNASRLEDGSIAGPVRSRPDLPPQPDGGIPILAGPLGTTRHDAALLRWARFPAGDLTSAYRFGLDGADLQFTTANEALLARLRPGDHTFLVERADGSLPPTVRLFRVEPTLVPEREPNDAPSIPTHLPLGVGMEGVLADDADVDWYRVPLPNAGLATLHVSRPEPGPTRAALFQPFAVVETAALAEVVVEGGRRPDAATSLALQPGDHLLRVVGTRGAYRLALLVEPLPTGYVWDAEPNDEPLRATVVPLATREIAGTLNTAQDVDWYRLDAAVTAPSFWEFHLAQHRVPDATTVDFYPGQPETSEPIGTVAASSTNPLGVFRTGARTGPFFLRVRGAVGTPYAIRARLAPLPDGEAWEVEPNDQAAQATALSPTTQRLYAVLRPKEEDWFRVEVPAGEPALLRWKVRSPGGWTGATARAFAAPDARTPSDQIADVRLDGSDETEVTVPARAGVYLLQVKGSGDTPAPYEVLVSREPLPVGLDFEFEPNGAASRANALRVDTTLSASLWSPQDADWFRLNVEPSTRTVVFTVERASSGEAVRAEVLNAALAPLAEMVADAAHLLRASVAVSAVGRQFFVRVTGTAPGAYRLGALVVERAEHGATAPLGVGGVFAVRVEGSAGWKVRAELSAAGVAFPLLEETPGRYRGDYTVRAGDNVTDGALVVVIETPNVLRAELPLQPLITLDTTPPGVRDLQHSGLRPLKAGDTLRISLRTEPGATAHFEIARDAFRVLGELFDDGAHDDGAPNDGLYAGVFQVSPRDNVREGVLTVRVLDAVGNEATASALRAVTLDTTPPVIESVEHSATRILRAGDLLVVRVRGEPGATGNFSLGDLRKGLPLLDTGAQGDEVAGDGVYTGLTLIHEGDNAANALLTVQLTDLAGNTASLSAPIPVSVDTEKPKIESVTHNATRPLRKGEKLAVRLKGDANGSALFDIGADRIGIPLFDDGAGDDEKASDGIYTGAYVVREDDNLAEQAVIAHLTDANGNTETRAASQRVTLDAIPPAPVAGLRVEDVPNDQGNRLRVAWQPTSDRDFLRYHIYRQTAPIRSTRGLLPVASDLIRPDQTALELDAPANTVDYYFAVTALDSALNESELAPDGSSVFGPVQAKDDLPPAAVEGVTARDAPEDEGRTLLVAWETESGERDFLHYAVFTDAAPFSAGRLAELKPAATQSDRTVGRMLVPVIADATDMYVAVVAVDVNGNRSPLTATSTAGPVQSADNVAPVPVAGVTAADTPGDDGGRLTVGWKMPADPTVAMFDVLLAPFVKGKGGWELVRTVRVAELGKGTPSASVATPRDEEDFLVGVVAVDGGGNRSEIAPESQAGPVRSVVNILSAASETVIRAGFDPRTSVRISARAARVGLRVDILDARDSATQRLVEEANLNLAGANMDPALDEPLRDTVRLVASGDRFFSGPVALTVPFPPLDVSELARDLRIFRLNTEARPVRWEILPGTQAVDEDEQLVTAETWTPGVFRIARLLLPRRLDKIVVFPNPFSPERDGVLTFRNLTRNATIELFTLDARRVRELAGEASGTATWDGKSDAGVLVASGPYFYLIRSPNDRRVGQVFVIR